MEYGADANATNIYGETALINASSADHRNVVKLLLDNNANVNAKNDSDVTSLMTASMGGDEYLIKILIDYGANVNAKDENGYTALYYASLGDHEHIINFILNHPYYIDEPEYFVIQEESPNIQDEIIKRIEEKAERLNITHKTLASNAANLELLNFLIEREI